MRCFEEIGAGIEAAWRGRDYDELAFPAIAEAALRERAVHREIGHLDVLRWVLSTPDLPVQDDLRAHFGQPPVTVYHGRRFFIQVLLWLEGTTAIHRHGFSGAFQVLDGTSLHSRWDFEPRRRVTSRFLLGDLRVRDAALIDRGEVVAIQNDLIHALFHLDSPSATIVVRTYHEDEAALQYSYRPPSVAIDTFYQDPAMTRHLQALRFARRAAAAEHPALAAALIDGSDLHTAFRALEQVSIGRGDPDRMAPLFEAARRRHGDVVSEIEAAIHEDLIDRKIRRLRDRSKDPELQFFLAVLQSLPDRDAIEAVVRQRHPEGDPRARIRGWLRELSGVRAIGVDLDDDLTRIVVDALIDGCSFDELIGRLKEEFDPADVDAQVDAIARHCDRVRRTAVARLIPARR